MKKALDKSYLAIVTGSLVSFLKNKYYLSALIFIVWITCFDKNSYINAHHKLDGSIATLRDKISFYRLKKDEVSAQYENNFSDLSSLETFAREKYFMKKSNEDVFIITEEQN